MAKLNLNRVPMPRQDPKARIRNFDEVALGYSFEQAQEEANRCILCPTRNCIKGCPVGVDIPEFIRAIRDGNMPEAVRILKDKNSLPGICGRVCPQKTQCEASCVLAKKGAPIAIGRLARYTADWERANIQSIDPSITPSVPTNKRVAVVGSGPAGLTAAADLAKFGHSVTIFEALQVAGGVLMYGIPAFRLPKDIVRDEISYVTSLGVKIELNTMVGKMITVDELLDSGYQAVFLSPGAGVSMFMNIPGETLNGIYSANEFLTRVNLMKTYRFPEYDTPIKIGNRVAVIGGGNVTVDSARCALRLGAKQVYIIYRRSKKEMPATAEERDNAEEEGVIFKLLTNPKRYIGDEHGQVKAIELYEMELGEPDESGRRRPIPKPGTEYIFEIDTVIAALGTRINPIISSTTKGLEITKWGTIVTDEATGKTSKPGVWCGGDIATGAATVASAMGAGKRAAADIDEYLRG